MNRVVCDKKRKSLKQTMIGERERERERRERERERDSLCSKMQWLGYYLNPKYFLRATLDFCKEGRGIFFQRKRERPLTTKKSF